MKKTDTDKKPRPPTQREWRFLVDTLQSALATFRDACDCGDCHPCTTGQADLVKAVKIAGKQIKPEKRVRPMPPLDPKTVVEKAFVVQGGEKYDVLYCTCPFDGSPCDYCVTHAALVLAKKLLAFAECDEARELYERSGNGYTREQLDAVLASHGGVGFVTHYGVGSFVRSLRQKALGCLTHPKGPEIGRTTGEVCTEVLGDGDVGVVEGL